MSIIISNHRNKDSLTLQAEVSRCPSNAHGSQSFLVLGIHRAGADHDFFFRGGADTEDSITELQRIREAADEAIDALIVLEADDE